jgi:7,8-dihydropterin-6-yl-methyl-4-(beta-D-ribofuranosyl)aminobenzene 5'-phosphate synthase
MTPASAPVPELDELSIIVVVDNATDTLSSIAPGIPQRPELAAVLASGPPSGHHDGHDCVVLFDRLCVACHGFSALVTARKGERTVSVLFDVGPYGEVWLANAKRLGLDLSSIDVLFLSHWHWDHSGGFAVVVAAISAARQAADRGPLVVDVHPARPDQRGFLLPSGVFLMFPPEPTIAAIESAGGQVVAHADLHTLGDGLLLASGDIPRRTSYETGSTGHHSWRGQQVTLDPEIHDERFLAASVRGRGTTVLTACSHAGVVNVGLEAKRLVPERPIDLLLGGYHLVGAVEDRIEPTVRDLADLVGPQVVGPGHCTGWRAAAALVSAFSPTSYAPSVVGSRYLLTAP